MARKLAILGLLGLLLVAGSGYAGWRQYQQFLSTPLTVPADGFTLQLEPGTSYRGLVSQLRLARLTVADWQWRLVGRLAPEASQIKAGEYLIVRGTTPLTLLEQLVEGAVVQYQFTIVEGHTFRELLAELREHPQITRSLDDQTGPEIMRLLDSEMTHPEGAFLPETYRFPAATSDLEFLRRAHQALNRKLAAEWAAKAAGLPYKTPYEALIMASIIEKETARADERARIAGVFVRRLRKGMRLQTDPTVIYGMGSAYAGNIRKRDLLTDTPYNTYTRRGLTPTPIAMASGAAIQAALHPADGDELFFVATGDGKGSHHFSVTLREHERAVDRYQRGIR